MPGYDSIFIPQNKTPDFRGEAMDIEKCVNEYLNFNYDSRCLRFFKKQIILLRLKRALFRLEFWAKSRLA